MGQVGCGCAINPVSAWVGTCGRHLLVPAIANLMGARLRKTQHSDPHAFYLGPEKVRHKFSLMSVYPNTASFLGILSKYVSPLALPPPPPHTHTHTHTHTHREREREIMREGERIKEYLKMDDLTGQPI